MTEIFFDKSGEKDKRYNSAKSKRTTNNDNTFIFSEKAKTLMKNDEIEISSINGDNKIKSQKKYYNNKNIKLKQVKTKERKDRDSNKIFGEEERNYINDKKRDSVKQILDHLI